jgi:hypothetical protein
MQKREERKEMLVGCGALLGAVLAVLGLIGAFTFFTAGTYSSTYTRDPSSGAIRSIGAGALFPLAIGMLGLGILLFLVSTGYGWLQHARRNQGTEEQAPSALVVAKYAYNKDFTLLTQPWEFDYDDARFYVRMRVDAENVLEFETSRPVFDQCGEGMRGSATFQGKWLSRFVPHTGLGVYMTDDRMAQHHLGDDRPPEA